MRQKLIENKFAVPVLPLGKHERVRASVVALFREPDPGSPEMLQTLSQREWKAMLRWLDTSGLALYLFDRLRELDLLDALPQPVHQRLQQNLHDNTERTRALADECCSLQKDFDAAGVSSAVLKGISLWPHSVPRLELRSQLDLDFLIAAVDAPRAQSLLKLRGYRLHAVSGRSWEFKTPYAGAMTLADLYRPSPQRTVELHLEEPGMGLLGRCEHHTLHEVSVPVLPAAELFLGQALHLYKHLSRDQMRCSHLIELYRHLLARGDDSAFWARVESLCAAQPCTAACLGVALEFVSQQMELSCVPVAVRPWTLDQAPPAARVWVQRYGARVMTAAFPGTKLHLLLQEAMLQRGVHGKRSIATSLLPRRLPPSISIPPMSESLEQALKRQLRQARFILFRLRFHLREGARYLLERRRWRALLEVAEDVSPCSACEIPKPVSTRSIRVATKP